MTAHEIDLEAADWAAKVDRGLSADEQSDLERWLAGDARRVGAYGRIRAIAIQVERVAALGPLHGPREAPCPQPLRPTRRNLLMASGAIAASVAAMGLGGWAWLSQQRFRTQKGQVRQFAFSDGSVVTLNTESDLTTNFSKDRREIRLKRGEALFDVAHDETRPFVVVAGAIEARAIGTSFVVRCLSGEATQVLVREGIVEVVQTDRASPPRRVTANMRAIDAGDAAQALAAPISVESLSHVAVQRALAWREGRIVFEGETLERAAAEFGRYSDIQIILDDPALATEEIAGLYQANDPIEFAKSVALSLRAETVIGNGVIHIRKASS